MLRKLFVAFLIGIVGVLHAQQLKVVEFRADLSMADANQFPKEDYSGNRCGLIKLGLALPPSDVAFEGDIISSENKEGEWWIYMPRGSNWLTIKSKSNTYLPLRYEFEGIQSNVTYIMNVEKPSADAEPEIVREQYLFFQIRPTDAVLEVNNQQWTVSREGTARKFVKFGTYSYRVQAPNYYPETGTVTVNDPKEKKTVTIDLNPNFGWIEVKGNSIQGAAVYVDNAYIGKAPCKSEALKSGEHTVRIAKEMYAPFNEKIIVSDNKTTTLSPTLIADFAKVTLTVDADAEIWVNEEKKGTRTWTGNLSTGTYRMECRQDNHETKATTIEITHTMDGQTIALPAPKPIYGMLNVESTPDFAKIYVDGKPMGETPNFISQILIGQHELKLTKSGYTDYIETFTIAKGERKQVIAMLNEIAKDEETFTVNGVSFTMKLVEGGTFQMGATSEQVSDALGNEKPVHSVTLSNYYIGETEVTQALWKAVMGSNPSSFKGDNLPVESVSWNDCHEFIRRLNQKTGKDFRLPTEAEWEYAARGGKKSNGYKYAGSNTIGSVAWFTGNSSSKTHSVKGKVPNELGLYDMTGNVWEWCSDWYGSDYYGKSLSSNPQGPSSGSYRVLRGSSWNGIAWYCRVSFRLSYDPDYRRNFNGFRLALPAATQVVGNSQQAASSGSGTYNGHEYVDLGLPSGTLWATCNVGANSPEDYGNYYAWGETTTKTTYNWSNYKYGAYDKLTKYCSSSGCGYNGFTDNLTVLQSSDDAAIANWGSGWCVPTKAQWEELKSNTTLTWTIQNGVNGMLFTASNGNTLFLPAAGICDGSSLDNAGSYGYYLSSSLNTDYSSLARNLNFGSDHCGTIGGSRYFGQSVRPVHSIQN